jgi:DNA-nicking Smr family endonuclease
LTPQEQELWAQTVARLDAQLPPVTVLAPVSKPVKNTTRPPSSATIDLHGLTLDSAHKLVLERIGSASLENRSLLFITGKSGLIRQEFSRWLENHASVRQVEELNGGGAFRVHFRRKK